MPDLNHRPPAWQVNALITLPQQQQPGTMLYCAIAGFLLQTVQTSQHLVDDRHCMNICHYVDNKCLSLHSDVVYFTQGNVEE